MKTQKIRTLLLWLISSLYASGLLAQNSPASVSASFLTQNSVKLSWPAASGVSGYRIAYKPYPYVTFGATEGAYVDVPGDTSQTYVVTGLSSSSTYTFAVYGYSQNIHGVKTYSFTAATVDVSTLDKNTLELNFEQQASMVIGQSSLESSAGPNQGHLFALYNTLSYPFGVHVTKGSGGSNSNGKILVADQGNHRIAIYNSVPTSFNAQADVFIGQPDGMSTTSGTARNKFKAPYSVWVTTLGDTNFLFVCDAANNRVLMFDHIPSSTGLHNATKVFGQSAWDSSRADCKPNRMNTPVSVTTEGRKLIVADESNNRVLIWNNFTAAASLGANADVVIGQPDFYSNKAAAQFSDTSSHTTLAGPYGVAVNKWGRLVIASRLEHRVLIYNSIPTVNGDSADLVLGQSNFNKNSFAYNSVSAASIPFPSSVSISSNYTHEKLAIGDAFNNRIMVWNTFPLSNNQPADVVLGAPDLNTNSATQFSSGTGFNACSVRGFGGTCWAPNGDFYTSDNYSRVTRFDKGNGEMITPTLQVTAVTDSSVSLSWTGGNTKQYRIAYTAGNNYTSEVDKMAIIDGIEGNSYTLQKLLCHTKYRIYLYPSLSSPQRFGTETYVETATLKGTACQNKMPITNGPVKAIATYGNIIYIGGDFSQVNGENRNALAAIDGTTYELLAFNPDVKKGAAKGIVNTLKISKDGTHLFVGGDFDAVGASSKNGLAKVNTGTGNAVSGYPGLNSGGTVSFFAQNYGSDYVFFYGDFTSLGAVNGYQVTAGVDSAGNVISSFKPVFAVDVTEGYFRSIGASPDNKYVYLGGNVDITYKDVAGNDAVRHGIAELKVDSAYVTSFEPFTEKSGIFDIVCTSGALYLCGNLTKVIAAPGTVNRRSLVKFSGAPGNWTLNTTFVPIDSASGPNKNNSAAHEAEHITAALRGMWLHKNRLYVCGESQNFGGVPRYGVFAVDTGNATLAQEMNMGVNTLGSTVRMKMTGSETLKKVMVSFPSASIPYMLGKPYSADFICSRFDSNTVAASSHKLVPTTGATVHFNSPSATGVSITGRVVSKSLFVTVERYSDAPISLLGVSESNVSHYRFIIHRSSDLLIDSASIRFKLSDIPAHGITSPADVKVYRRNTYGYGPFSKVDTVIYDAVNGELVVETKALGEFIFASNSNTLMQRRLTDESLLAAKEESSSTYALGNDLSASVQPVLFSEPLVFPNPSASVFQIHPATIQGELKMQIFDLGGRLVEKIDTKGSTQVVFGQSYEKGIYLLQVEQAGRIYTYKLVKTQ